MNAMLLAVGVLVATYAGVMSERLNRSIVALLGALLMIALGILTQEQAISGIDFNTIGLLVGMMIIVSITRKCGVFEYLAIWSAKLVKASPAGILAMLAVVTAVVSAFLDNVTTVLLVVPVTLVITEQLKVNPYPFLFSQIIASNIGGTATLIGDPPNILIGTRAGISFNEFVINLTPVILVVLGGTRHFHPTDLGSPHAGGTGSEGEGDGFRREEGDHRHSPAEAVAGSAWPW